MADPVLPSPTPAVISRTEAKALGLTRYFTGRACQRGHVTERDVSNGGCVACLRLMRKRKYRENIEKMRKKQAEYRVTHAEEIKKRREAWIASNPGKMEAYRKVYYDANRQKMIDSAVTYNQANPEKRAEANRVWRKKNPEKAKAVVRNRIARKRAAQGSHTAADIQRIYEAQDGRCKYCYEKVGNKYHVDHRQPLARGGSNWWHNLQILCPRCNQRKHAKDPIDYEWENGY